MADDYINNMIESNELPTIDMYECLVTEACKRNFSLLGSNYLQDCLGHKFDIPGVLCEKVLELCIDREDDAGVVIIFDQVLQRCKLSIGWNDKSVPLHLDLGTHLAVLNLAARTGNMQLAQLCVKSFKQCGYERNQEYYDALFQTMVGSDMIKKSFGVLAAAERDGIQLSTEVKALLIDRLVVRGQELLPNITMWLKTQRHQEQLTTISAANCLMATYTKLGRNEEVATMLAEWDQYCQVPPNTETFNIVLESQLATHTAETFEDKEKEILLVMKQSSILPDAGSLEAMVRKRIALGLWDRALAQYDKMLQLGFAPSQPFLELLIRRAALFNDVDSALRFTEDLAASPFYTPRDIAAMLKVVPTIKQYDIACEELMERVLVGDRNKKIARIRRTPTPTVRQ